MITQFIPAPKVDDHTYIALYRDNEDPFTFYYINSRPRISIDNETKKPALDYMVIGRDIKREGAQGVQEGRLVMTVNLALTKEEMAAVENTVKKYVAGKVFEGTLNQQYYPKYNFSAQPTSLPSALRTNSVLKIMLNALSKARQVTIKPVDYISGSASVDLASSDFEGKFTHETKPTLFGDCNATFAANLDSQESQILYEIFKPQKKDDKSVNISTVIHYDMKYNTVVPFNVKAKIHYQRVYSEFQNMAKTHAGVDSRFFGRYSIPNVGTFYSYGADLYVSKETLTNYLRNSDSSKQFVEITIIDNGKGEQNEKYEELILSALQAQLAQNVCDKLFEKAQPLNLDDPAVSQYDVGTTGSKGSESSDKKRNVMFDVSYKLRSDVNTSVTNDFEMTINKDKVIEVEANPQGSLEVLLENYKMDDLVRELDASDIYFQEMLVPIKVDNANFGRDIAMVSVRVVYKGKDGKEKMNRVFDFDEENPDTKTFRVIMDRDSDRKLIDKFYYQTRIRYRGFDVYGKKDENEKWTKVKEAQGIGEGIYVPYSDMLNLCVNCRAGDVAWDVIEKMDVELKYKDAPDQKGATKIITLTASNSSDAWNCYMYSGTSNYLYRIHYYYYDGSDDWSKQFESASEELVVNDKLSGVFRTKFDLNFKKSIERVRVIVKCQGKEEDSGWITQPDTWTWQTRLKEDGKMTYQYKYQYYLVNGDDSMQSVDWSAPVYMNTDSNQQTITIDLRVNQISLIIDGESIDWNKWSRVYLHFKYDDAANNLHYDDEKIPPLKLSANKNEGTVIIPVIDESIRPRIFAEYIPQVGDDVVASDEMPANKIVILPNAAPPKCEKTEPAASAAAAPAAPAASVASAAPAPAAAPVVRDLNLTFSVKSMDWNKWMRIYVHVRYDDDANGIHINDNSMPPFKMMSGSDDKTISFQIKNPDIQPKIMVDYMSNTGDVITTNATPVAGPVVNLPDAVPPQG